ncbi:glucosaminidase domain-containing protein [Patescibacteria group bacterium]|nr:glucosaminidase domain-containing protein [Patescibacteria group bacterium]
MSKKRTIIQLNTLPFLAVFAVSSALTRIPAKQPAELTVAFIGREFENGREEKIIALRTFLEDQKSPLLENAETFVDVAEKYGMDYRLLPAIACMESSCGKRLIPGSYNPFGWGIYGNNAIHFKSYDEAIEVVGKGISEKYFSRGLDTPEKMAPVYTPPNSVKWKNGVNFFISKIENPKVTDNTTLFSS